MKYIYAILLLLSTISLFAQNRDASVYGTIKDADSGENIDIVTVYIEDTNFAVETNLNGFYRIKVPSNQPFTIAFSRIGYKPTSVKITGISTGKSKKLDVSMVSTTSDLEVIVTESKIEEAGIIREEVTELRLLPTTTGNLESVLPWSMSMILKFIDHS